MYCFVLKLDHIQLDGVVTSKELAVTAKALTQTVSVILDWTKFRCYIRILENLSDLLGYFGICGMRHKRLSVFFCCYLFVPVKPRPAEYT